VIQLTTIVTSETFISASRIDLGLPLAIVELLARAGSLTSITLLVLLFLGEGLHPSEIASSGFLFLLHWLLFEG
jgi:hypothetical protein